MVFLEYEKIKTINGDLLPITTTTMTLTIDGYYFYNIGLLTRVNIDNTTTPNVYKNNNGFPVGISSITISSSSMTASLQATNQKSILEIEAIDDKIPSEYNKRYWSVGYKYLEFRKFDLQSETYYDTIGNAYETW